LEKEHRKSFQSFLKCQNSSANNRDMAPLLRNHTSQKIGQDLVKKGLIYKKMYNPYSKCYIFLFSQKALKCLLGQQLAVLFASTIFTHSCLDHLPSPAPTVGGGGGLTPPVVT
jgi:hypothetical protein